jgi:hypothetical protein
MQAIADELGIPQPSQVIGAQDDQSRQLIALANREGKEFSTANNGKGGWQALHKEHTFQTVAITVTGDTTAGSAVITNISSTTGISANTFGCNGSGIDQASIVTSVDSATQVTLSKVASATATGVTLTFGQVAYSLPSDLEYFADRTFWDGAMLWELLGPISAQQKQLLRYGIVANGPRSKFYIRDNLMWLNPMPASAFTIAYDYYSNAWCSSSGGAAQKLWAADTDTYDLDEDAFIMGVKWRWLRAKGLDYAQEKIDYDMEVSRLSARDGGMKDLPLAGGNFGTRFLNDDNIPETGYGQL